MEGGLAEEADEWGEVEEDRCDQRMVHRQVGNSSITFNEGASVLLVSPHVTWSLGEHNDLFFLEQAPRELGERMR